MNPVPAVMYGLRNGALKKVPRAIRNVTFACPIEAACMMHVIARHYQVSNSVLATELFTPLVQEMFDSLTDDQQKMFAAQADAELVAFLNKPGLIQDTPVIPPVSETHWQDLLQRRKHPEWK